MLDNTVNNEEVVKETKQEELRKAHAETKKEIADADDAKGKAVLTLLQLLSAEKERWAEALTEQQRQLYGEIMEKLKSDMAD